MMRLTSLLALAVVASPVSAQNSAFCQELWLSRNTIMDRAGQCFGTPLGQAVFDNSDCMEGDIRLTPLDAEIVRMAREAEARARCRVDIGANHLAPPCPTVSRPGDGTLHDPRARGYGAWLRRLFWPADPATHRDFQQYGRTWFH
ncbi:YARHG domain-containing protein [Rhodobacteraceae bacterium N5(2021)]|uniref:YARHG domain-containing protein n=1 Tax=Gymnodinialimonas phycosphaerae TaxID=2841589 RepID=A0A975TS10_9RHOB|nr:YARHG domain-containing protein [Gymnodinialimonas phycosphaerae]